MAMAWSKIRDKLCCNFNIMIFGVLFSLARIARYHYLKVCNTAVRDALSGRDPTFTAS
jgi:hypothetical protein